MAELKLSTVWKIKGFADRSARMDAQHKKYAFKSDELPQLRHKSLPGLQWHANLYSSSTGEAYCSKGLSAFWLQARFGSSEADATYVLASFGTALLDANGSNLVTFVDPDRTPQVVAEKYNVLGDIEAFKTEDLNKAVHSDGSLQIRIDLTVLKIDELLNCRKLLRGLLANSTHADFEVKVGNEAFKLHKSVLAATSTVFSGMLQSGMKEADEGILTLSDTTPAAFKAFSEAIYSDNWDFVFDTDLTQDVLHLAEKFDIGNLKTYCDDSLAEKVDESNALEILTRSAALCNAEKSKAACIEVLTVNMDFKESEVWLDFKKRNRGVALEILDAVSDKCFAKFKSVEAANADLKRKSEEATAKPSSSKRRRK